MAEQPRRVRRPKDKEDLVQRLTDGKDAVFPTYRELLIFAASLGFFHEQKKGFTSSAEPIPWSYFANTPGEQLVDMLTAATVSDPSALGSTAEHFNLRLELFEQYANGGLEILHKELQLSNAPPDEVIRNMRHRSRTSRR
jgi:dnd system-associated protein 4